VYAGAVFVNIPGSCSEVGAVWTTGDEVEVVSALQMSGEALRRRQFPLTNYTPGIVSGSDPTEWHPAADCVVALGGICVCPSTTETIQATTYCQTEVPPLLIYWRSADAPF